MSEFPEKTERTPEEIEEDIQRLKEESDKLTDWPKWPPEDIRRE